LLLPLWLLLAPVRPELSIAFLVPATVFAVGFISFLDRGNNAGLTIAFLAWALWAWRKERWVWCGGFLVAAIALKAYPAALLVVPLALHRYRFAIATAAAGVAGNLVMLGAYPGGYLTNLRAIWPALQGKGDPLLQLYSWSLYSVIPRTSGLVLGPLRVRALLQPDTVLVWLPAVLYVVGLFVVIRRGRVPQWCWGPLALATTQLLVPLSYAYTTTWATVGAVWFARGTLVDTGRDEPPDDSRFVPLRVLLMLALTVTLTPSAFELAGRGGFDVPFGMFLSPVLLFATLVVAVISSFLPRPAQPAVSRVTAQRGTDANASAVTAGTAAL
jgi:hypothetical protein